jgi:hypothetical protein
MWDPQQNVLDGGWGGTVSLERLSNDTPPGQRCPAAEIVAGAL